MIAITHSMMSVSLSLSVCGQLDTQCSAHCLFALHFHFECISRAICSCFCCCCSVAATRRSWIIKKKLLLLTQDTYEIQWTAPPPLRLPLPLLFGTAQAVPQVAANDASQQEASQSIISIYLAIHLYISLYTCIRHLFYLSIHLSICLSVPPSLYASLHLARAQWEDNVLGSLLLLLLLMPEVTDSKWIVHFH